MRCGNFTYLFILHICVHNIRISVHVVLRTGGDSNGHLKEQNSGQLTRQYYILCAGTFQRGW